MTDIIQTRNDEAGFIEFLNDDVTTIVREIDGSCAILLDMNTRQIVGYRVYDPVSKPVAGVEVKPLIDAITKATDLLNIVILSGTTITEGHDGPNSSLTPLATQANSAWCDLVSAQRILSTPAQEQAHPDDLAVDRFSAEMKAKLAKKRAEVRGGWDRKDECSAEFLSQLLREHVEKGDPVDVGNLAMMLQQRGERIAK